MPDDECKAITGSQLNLCIAVMAHFAITYLPEAARAAAREQVLRPGHRLSHLEFAACAEAGELFACLRAWVPDTTGLSTAPDPIEHEVVSGGG